MHTSPAINYIHKSYSYYANHISLLYDPMLYKYTVESKVYIYTKKLGLIHLACM